MKLELAYLTNPAIFDRGSEIRRSEGRIKLKERTGMDDSQLEGWRVMLDRNVSLTRHQTRCSKDLLNMERWRADEFSHIKKRS